ncbi:MAG: oligopeptide transport system ATP-binding protein [Clostridia bacterium]|nr:oligopeptide transport system ATP-binding protein [Clostridia bacterium]
MGKERILELNDLHVSFDTYSGEVHAVRGVSFHLDKGEAIAIVGESGCGKSVTAKSIMKLIPMPPGRIKKGNILFNGKDITNYTKKQMEVIRGSEIGMIFQDPMTSLSPTMLVGKQIAEGLIQHQKLSKKQAHTRSIEMLRMVGIPNPDKRVNQYPHEFSGGMRQRVMIAIALACNPKVLIADEPTTALDVTIQAQILDLMKELKKQIDTSIILITHDLGVVAGMADRVLVMYAGKVVESGKVEELFKNPKHPYTVGLLKSVPRLDLENKEELIPISGTPPDLFAPPTGCGFAARCVYAMKVCYLLQPQTEECGEGHHAACWLLHQYAPAVSWV